MSVVRLAPWVVAVAAELVYGAACTSAAPQPPRPDILVVTLDTVRADALPGFGGDATDLPHLSAWIASGVRFTRAYTTAPLTLPAHASLWSGLEPFNHGVRHQTPGSVVQPPLHLIRAARAAGYSTAAFVGASLLAPERSRLDGFDVFAAPVEKERSAAQVMDAAERWVNTQPPDRPLLVWLHLFDAHFLYRPTRWQWRECPERARKIVGVRLATAQAWFDRMANPEPWWPPCLRDLYRGEILDLDLLVPRMRALLASRGDYLWALLSDHGECLGEEGVIARHAATLLECAVRIPLTFGGQGWPRSGEARDELVSIIDVAPTVAARMGWELTKVQGRDLLAPAAAGPVYFEAAGLDMPLLTHAAVGGWVGEEKVTLRPDGGMRRAWRRSADGIAEIDPSALSPAGRALTATLLAQPPPPSGVSAPIPVADHAAALRALGYVQ